MPLYEYECSECGERTELIQRLSDPPLSDCPKCGKPVRKLLSAPSFQFKGSGWYVTDYAGKSSGTEAGSDDGTKSEKKDTATASGGSESKKGKSEKGGE